MLTWPEFQRDHPELAEAGRTQLFQWDVGLGFLATVRADGGPRVHPVCPVVNEAGLYVLVVAGPKQADLRRDGRCALHSETCPPPRQDDGFYLAGRAREVSDPAAARLVRQQVIVERGNPEPWPTFEDDVVFELMVERCLLTLTQPDGFFPAGPTVWVAGRSEGAGRS